ncbi:MAG TPA: molybdopterin molybdotransferase MoeA [Opitutaceae bacterium]|nr:molybdopterin molybdotransferase MoeA [Opitutaceae bacterium]
MLPVAEAEKQVLAAVRVLPAEDCPLADAHGRVLRQVLVADRDLPPFDRVAMDGFALRYDLWEAGIRRFRVAGVQAAGTIARPLPAADACIEVMTGAVLPAGADVVVPVEDVTRKDGFIQATAEARVAPGQAIHRRGSDHLAGAVIVHPGVRLGGREIAVAAACGYAHLTVTLQPKIAVVATGDELVEVSSVVARHQIRRSNDYALRAALIAGGQRHVDRYHLHDMRREIEHRLWHIVAEYDVVLISGGVSKGKFDFLPRVLDDLGVRKLFQGVAQRPGGPFWFGLSPRHTPIFALPGNPASSYICLHRYVLPALAQMAGLPPATPQFAGLTEAVKLPHELAGFVPARIAQDLHGGNLAQPAPLNTSGDFAGLTGTSGFVELPAGQREFPAGACVRFWPWI